MSANNACNIVNDLNGSFDLFDSDSDYIVRCIYSNEMLEYILFNIMLKYNQPISISQIYEIVYNITSAQLGGSWKSFRNVLIDKIKNEFSNEIIYGMYSRICYLENEYYAPNPWVMVERMDYTPDEELTDLICTVLKAANGPLHYVDIGELIYEGGFRTLSNNNLWHIVNTQICGDIATNGSNSKFRCVGDGIYSYVGHLDTNYPISETNFASAINKYNLKYRYLFLNYLQAVRPYDFQKLVKYLLCQMGFKDIEVRPETRDGGIDVDAKYVPHEYIAYDYKVQVKRFNASGKVRVNVIRELRGCLTASQQGFVIATCCFTSDAIKESKEKGRIPIATMNG